MKRLWIFLAVFAVLWLPGGAGAQTSDDRGYLQAFLEDNLSDAGRQVRIIGFAGGLSKRATIDELTIADDSGIWLTLRKVVLDWDRAALLKGHLNITQLSANEIVLPRSPAPAAGNLPTPEASGFALPELPVTVTIGSLNAPRIELGEALFGEAAVISLQGSAKLEAGAGQAKLTVERTDGPRGALNFEAEYANATRFLKLALVHSEAENGIAANLIGLPDRPAVDLAITGTGPLDDFAAEIRLATDGAERLTGQVILTGAPAENATGAGTQSFRADIGGDIAPVFLPAYRAFFGPDVQLTLAGARHDDGRLQIDTLALATKAMQLNGQLGLDADGWPETFSLTGEIADESGDAVVLPLPGAETRIERAALDITYDRALGDAWRGATLVVGLAGRDGAITEMRLTGAGTLKQGGGAAIGGLVGHATYAAHGIAPADPALARAIGPTLSGGLRFEWAETAPLQITNLVVSGADYGLGGTASVQGLRDGLNLVVAGDAALTAQSLARFSDLVGLPLDGAAVLNASGKLFPLSGVFDLNLDGTATDLGVGQPRIDPLLDGASRLFLSAARDKTGTKIERFDVASEHATAQINGALASGTSALRFSAQIRDTARIETGFAGPATLTGSLQQTGTDWAVDMQATGPGQSTASATAIAVLDHAALGRITGDITAEVGALASYSQIAGRPLSGGAAIVANGWFDASDMSFAVDLDATGQSLTIGVPLLDQVLRGQITLNGDVLRNADGVVSTKRLALVTPQGQAQVTGTSNDDSTVLAFEASLRDLGLLAPGVTGPAQADGTATLTAQGWQVNAQGTGPGGAVGRAAGQVSVDGSHANLTLQGAAPLALVNTYIAPNLASGQVSYDLVLNGPMTLSSVSGQLRAPTARLAIPEQRLAVDPISAVVTLAGGRAMLDATAKVSSGGQVSLSGPVGLSSPFVADLGGQLSRVGVSDGVQYDSQVDGQVTIRGPLASGAMIAADLTLGTTELRIAESGADIAPVLAGLEHRGEPTAVRQTRARAGLLGRGGGTSGRGAVYPIDIMLRAPARVFVRGRGLDAELGGQLRLTGTTADVVPQGRFDLIRGRLDILGKRLTLSEGYAQLRGGFDPTLYLVAQTRSADTDIRIVIEGSAASPVVRFTSSPDLPEDEILARLLFARGLSNISPLQAVQLAAAVQTLAGSGTGILGKLREKLGLDDLDITTNDDGTTGAKVGKYLSDNIYSDVTVGSDGNTEINLNLQISPSITGRGTVKSTGESSLGIFIERDY